MISRLALQIPAIVIVLTIGPTHLCADDTYEVNWPQWRGPLANGVAPNARPPIRWDQQTNIKWKVPVPGLGHATPIVWNDRIYLLSAIENEDELPADQRPQESGFRADMNDPRPTKPYTFVVLAYDRDSGKEVWRRVARREVPHESRHRTNSYSSGSAVTDGRHLAAFFGSRGLFVYDLQGELLWEKDLGDMVTRNGFGEGSTPVLHENALVVLWDAEEDSKIYAFDKHSGEELWKRERDEKTGWTTPCVVDHDGTTQVIVNATNQVTSYDLATGETLWTCRGQTTNAIPSIVTDGERAYAMSGYRGSTVMAIQLGARGDLTDSDHVIWKLNSGAPYVPSPLLYGDLLYFCQQNSGILSCVDRRTGRTYFGRQRLEDLSSIYASPVGANGHVYLTGRDGTTMVLKKAETLEIVAVNRLEEPVDASLAVVGEEIYLRSHSHLYCIAE